MKIEEAIITRRSIKHFDPKHKLSEVEINKLLSLAILSPTAFNQQNWRFVIIDDTELRNTIRSHSWDQAQITDASLFIVLCADLKAWEKQPQRYWVNAPDDVRALMLPAMDDYYRNKHQVQRDEAMRSCGIAAQTLMLSARSMGYDSCPMDGFDFDEIAKIIHLPEDHVITMFITIGKEIKPAWPRPGQLSLEDIVFKDNF
ncbi:MAG: nitroreductase family protein [endosymbiont of Galathealinum brachiosum]|uniref:Nitroreductase family protein n=1 Tax=endosymbiont of Galathealinum brachiosum TaxID=2200906 RepID=A0A370DNW6_9GAMM|nr:MAG: nitroreductase family protein [endosymbiont of Galathealinum brachiosum]